MSSSTLSITLAQLFQAHRRAVAIGHDQRPVLRRRCVSWPVACSVKARCGPMIVPVGRLTFQLFSAVFDFVDADLLRGQRMRIHLHVHGVLLRAQHLHLRDAA